jgi:hypothetical protein
MGILDEGRRETGGGTQPPKEHHEPSVQVDLTMARTQSEADDIIHNQLSTRGLLRGTKAYQEAYDAAWKYGNVSSLPV